MLDNERKKDDIHNEEKKDSSNDKESSQKLTCEVLGRGKPGSSFLPLWLQAKDQEPRQWLIDRCEGSERFMDPNSSPCFPCFYTPFPIKYLPDIMEQNVFMETFGKCGIIPATNKIWRRLIMSIAVICTIAGWGALIASDFSISQRSRTLARYGYQYGEAVIFSRQDEFAHGQAMGIDIGLRAVSWYRFNLSFFVNVSGEMVEFPDDLFIGNVTDLANDTTIVFGNMTTEELQDNILYCITDEEVVVTGFDQFCNGDSGVFFVEQSQCNACREFSRGTVTSILMSTVFYVFSFTTDVVRMWRNYDVNCQKVFGGFIALITAALGLRTYFQFRLRCFDSFLQDSHCFDDDGNLIEGCDFDNFYKFDNVEFIADLHFDAGIGYILLGISTFLKLVNLVCHLIVPTPSITRDKDEQWEYERMATEQVVEQRQEEEQ